MRRWFYFCCCVILHFVMVALGVRAPQGTLRLWVRKRQVHTRAELPVSEIRVQPKRYLLLESSSLTAPGEEPRPAGRSVATVGSKKHLAASGRAEELMAAR